MSEKSKGFSGQVSCVVKITAMVFVALGFAFSGFYLASVYDKRTEILGDIMMMLEIVQTQLRYARLPLSPMLVLLEENKGNLGFLSECREMTQSGKSFPESWRMSIENDRELCRLIHGALPHLIRFGESLGTTDLDGQLSCCEYYERIFRKELEAKEEQSGKYSKLFPTLGIMLGVSAAILIV